MAVPEKVVELVKRFNKHKPEYTGAHYNEARLRVDFLDPFFIELGWDIQNTQGYAEAYRDVIHEESLKIGSTSKAPDYTFRIGGVRKFFVEAKKPAVSITSNFDAAYQIKRYAWSAKLRLSILTNFQDFYVFNCTSRPNLEDHVAKDRVLKFSCDDYEARWDELFGIFSKNAILTGSFDTFASEKTSKRGTTQVDQAFLKDISDWRITLARNIRSKNKLPINDLNFIVSQLIDRIIFLRICEDRGTEEYGSLQKLAKGAGTYKQLFAAFLAADKKYNSGLFYFKKRTGRHGSPDTLAEELSVSDLALKSILSSLYYPQSPYEFSVLPIEILGQVYEQFLGQTIVADGRSVKPVDKPEIKKAGGVVYTPKYIVDYMIAESVSRMTLRKTYVELLTVKVLDPACGSGTFLIGAYEAILDAALRWHLRNNGVKRGYVYQSQTGDYRLTTAIRREILLNCIFGVDVDPQAVEVTKLSLLLKLLEGESGEVVNRFTAEFHQYVLPDLDDNVKTGNSIVGDDIRALETYANLTEDQRAVLRPFDYSVAFPTVTAHGGFDVVVGNPPYVLMQGDFRNDVLYSYWTERFAARYKLDTYHIFIEKCLRLLRADGYATLITPSNYLTNTYLDRLRRKMLEDFAMQFISVFDGKVFAKRSVDTAVFLARKVKPTPSFPMRWVKADETLATLDSETVLRTPALKSKLVLFTGATPESALIWKRLEQAGVDLSEIAHIHFGKQLRDREKYPDDVLESQDIDEIPEGYVACYTGDDVERYHLKWSGLAALETRAAKRGGCWDPKRQRAKGKVLTRQIGFWPIYALDPKGIECLNTVFMIEPKDERVSAASLLGVLNSTLLRAYWLEYYWDRRRTFPKIKSAYLEMLPLPKLLVNPSGDSLKVVRRIEEAVAEMLSLNEIVRTPQLSHRLVEAKAELTRQESIVDAACYELYGVDANSRGTILNVTKSYSERIGISV